MSNNTRSEYVSSCWGVSCYLDHSFEVTPRLLSQWAVRVIGQWLSLQAQHATSGRPKTAERGLDQHHKQRQTTGCATLSSWPDHNLGKFCSRPTEIPREKHSTTRDSWFFRKFLQENGQYRSSLKHRLLFWGLLNLCVCVLFFVFIGGVILLSTPFYYSLKIILQPWISFVFSCSWVRILRRKNSTCFWQMKQILFPSVCSLRNSWCVVAVWLFCEKGKLWYPTKPFISAQTEISILILSGNVKF